MTEGFIDLPLGGRVGGFIALSDGIRVAADGRIGFAPRQNTGGSLPTGTTWDAKFTTVPPAEAELWRQRMGLSGETPFKIEIKKGTISRLAYIAECEAVEGGISGTVSKTSPELYRLPVQVNGVNYNWDAALWRPGQEMVPVDVFEGAAWSRLDVAKAGEFYIGNLVMAGNPALKISIVEWSSSALKIDVNNPTDRIIECEVWTAAPVKDLCQIRNKISIPPGTSQIIECKPGS